MKECREPFDVGETVLHDYVEHYCPQCGQDYCARCLPTGNTCPACGARLEEEDND